MKKNKKFTILLVIIAAFAPVGVVLSQPGPPSEEKKEEIEAMKVAFLTRKLDLTPDEAKTFWPVYNQYWGELDKIRDARRKEMKSSREEFDTMGDKDLEKIVDGEIAFRQSELDILKKYNSQFKQTLPMKKVAKLYRAEEDFKRELLHRIQERKENKGGAHPDRRR